jgi:hypothetical protein
MSESSSADASITFHQDGIRGFGSALINAQTYELFIDQQKVGELTGYTSEKTCSLSSGPHAIYVRAYARDSVSPTRIHGYSETLDIDLSSAVRPLPLCLRLASYRSARSRCARVTAW